MSAMNDEAPKSEASDTYEAKYMEGGAALARSKKRMPWWFFALLFTPLVAIPAATLASGAPFLATLPGLLLSVVMMSLAGLLLSHLRPYTRLLWYVVGLQIVATMATLNLPTLKGMAGNPGMA